MKVSLAIFILLLIFAFAQLPQDNFYSNSEVGLSINFEKEWNVIQKNDVPIFGYTPDKDIFISISWVSAKSVKDKTINNQTIAETKSIISNYFKRNEIKINELSVYKDKFLGNDCIVIVANVNDPRYFKGAAQYSKTIKVFHKDFLFNIETMIPYSKFSNNKLLVAKKQLNSIQLF